MKEGKKIVCKKFLAVLMLNGANGVNYNDFKRSTKENFVTRTSTYPKCPEAVLSILNAYQPPAGLGKCRQEGPKKELCLLKLKKTTRGRQE